MRTVAILTRLRAEERKKEGGFFFSFFFSFFSFFFLPFNSPFLHPQISCRRSQSSMSPRCGNPHFFFVMEAFLSFFFSFFLSFLFPFFPFFRFPYHFFWSSHSADLIFSGAPPQDDM